MYMLYLIYCYQICHPCNFHDCTLALWWRKSGLYQQESHSIYRKESAQNNTNACLCFHAIFFKRPCLYDEVVTNTFWFTKTTRNFR